MVLGTAVNGRADELVTFNIHDFISPTTGVEPTRDTHQTILAACFSTGATIWSLSQVRLL